MGQSLSCVGPYRRRQAFLGAIRAGDPGMVGSALRWDPLLLESSTVFDRLSALHIAAANGQVEVISMILDRSVHIDLLNRHKQTPLMLAAMHGKIACVQKLLQSGANILMFDSLHGRTCLHYAAFYGHSDCLHAILAAAQFSSVADSWGFARFVNVRDAKGATPLHLAARQGRPEAVRILLDNGALLRASTERYCCPGSTPLHLAAHGGCLDCVRELLTQGADRLQTDSFGRMPYDVALKQKHGACAALLNPSSAAPLVWPSPLKFIGELNPEVKALLETALTEANKEREKKILKGTPYSLPSPMHSDDGSDADDISEDGNPDLCSICFDQVCTIEVQDCRHQMCARCTLALCCHNKPNSATLCTTAPVCPFCRSNIDLLVVAKTRANEDGEKDGISRLRKARRSRNFSAGSSSSSFKGLSSAMDSLGKMAGRGLGKRAGSIDLVDKPEQILAL